VAKILVADDNSSVQKTVALALAELGVEVVSVNNGEAAVRKLADFSPDLVLADIFMPVRSGYEVCEHVKKDPRFAHVPVILLVGAFDPFDEREAQRVGADGILKKPFVPPNPLITMVKTLLDRTMSQQMVGVSAPKTSEAVPERSGADDVGEGHAPIPEISEETQSQEFPELAGGRVAFGEGERPVAFGHWLETPGVQTAVSDTGDTGPVTGEQILTNSRDATLGEPIFWRNDSPGVETEISQSANSTAEVDMPTRKQGEVPPPQHGDVPVLQPVEPLELIREEQDDTLPSVVDSGSVVLDQAAQASLNVEAAKPSELAANPMDWLATAPTVGSDEAPEMPPGRNELIADSTGTIESLEPSEHFELAVQPSMHNSDEATVQTAPPSTQTPEDTARSVPRHDSTELTANLDASASELEKQQITADAQPSPQPPPQAPEVSQAVMAHPSQSPAPDPALVEAVVQRVLDRLRPQVIDIITREFLRPVVLALVQREIEKL
jgi:CheY-like chemotaxis protein